MNKKEKNILDNLYEQGVGHDIGQRLRESVEWDTTHHIDWDDELGIDQETEKLIKFLSAQLHFNNMAYLTVCRNLMQTPLEERTRELVKSLIDTKIQELDGWAYYLSIVWPDITLGTFAENYYQSIYDEDNPMETIIGLEMISSIASTTMFHHINDLGDPLFQSIATRVYDFKEESLEHTRSELATILENMGESSRRELKQTADEYREQLLSISDEQKEQLAAIEDRLPTITSDLENRIDRFYTDIGLTK